MLSHIKGIYTYFKKETATENLVTKDMVDAIVNSTPLYLSSAGIPTITVSNGATNSISSNGLVWTTTSSGNIMQHDYNNKQKEYESAFRRLAEVFGLIHADPEKLAQYEAMKLAYEQYCVVAKLALGSDYEEFMRLLK